MAFRRTSYMTILGLAYQSYNFELGMTRHLLQMANAARKATTLESESSSNHALALEHNDESIANKLESESDHEQAIALEDERERDAAAAEASHVESGEFASKAAEEESRAELRDAAAAAEESLSDREAEKGLADVGEAAALEMEIEADGFVVGTCNFVPGLDFVCDVVGGIAALQMEASAVQWTAKSALDFTAAATAKEQENANLAASAALHVHAGEDTDIAADLQSEAAEEEARAEEEAVGSKREEMNANAKLTESKEEQALSKEENVEADLEQTDSSQWFEKSLVHGLAAFWDALLASLVSLMAFLFFVVRACVMVLVPSVVGLTNYLPLAMMLPSGRNVQKSNGLGTSDRRILRQMSYFLIHCGTFFTGIITFFGKFETIEKVNTRSKGGIILLFTLFVASVQSTLLHVLPHYRSIQRDATSLAISCLCTLWRGSCVFFYAVAHLAPLILMETLSLWLIFGHGIFSPNLSKNAAVYILALLLSTFVHIYIFEREEGCKESSSKTSADDGCHIPYCNTTSDPDPFIDNNEALGNERDSLLESDRCIDRKRCSGSDINATNEILELGPDGQGCVDIYPRHKITGYQSVTHDGSEKMPCHHSSSTDNYTAHLMATICLEDNYTSIDSKHDDKVVGAFDCRRILGEVSSATKKYFSVLQFPFEVLVMCCMFTFLKSSIPICKRLLPIFYKEFVGSHQRWFIIFIGAGVSISIVAFSWCLYGSSKKKSSNVHIGLFTGESVRTTIRSFLSDE